MRRVFAPILIACALAVAGSAWAQIALTEGALGGIDNVQVTTWRDIPFRGVIRQKYDYSCGSAALATLLRYHYNLDVDEARVFRAMYATGDQAKIRKVGFSLLDMKRYLSANGLAADGYRATFDQLRTANAPAIAVVSVGPYRHFVVVKGVRDGKVLIGDPAQGLKIYSRADFEKMWNHILFVVHGDKSQAVAYNRDAEWRPWAVAPLGAALDEHDLTYLLQLPPIYQITQARFQ